MGAVTSTVRSNESSATMSTSLMRTRSPGRTTRQRSAGTPQPIQMSTQACGPMKGTEGSAFCSTAAATFASMWSLWWWVASTASSERMANGSIGHTALRRLGCSALAPIARRCWWCGAISLTFWVDLPRSTQRSTSRLAPPSLLSQMPVQPSHHMVKVPGATSVCSISSLSQVPHSGKLPRIQDSRVMVSTLFTGAMTSCRRRGRARADPSARPASGSSVGPSIGAPGRRVNASAHAFAHMFRGR